MDGDYSSLPSLALRRIFSYLPTVKDVVQCTAVCKGWRDVCFNSRTGNIEVGMLMQIRSAKLIAVYRCEKGKCRRILTFSTKGLQTANFSCNKEEMSMVVQRFAETCCSVVETLHVDWKRGCTGKESLRKLAETLSHFGVLKAIELPDDGQTHDCWFRLISMSSIRALRLPSCLFENALKACAFEQLTELHLDCFGPLTNLPAAAESLPSLCHLELDFLRINSLSDVVSLPNLTHLSIGSFWEHFDTLLGSAAKMGPNLQALQINTLIVRILYGKDDSSNCNYGKLVDVCASLTYLNVEKTDWWWSFYRDICDNPIPWPTDRSPLQIMVKPRYKWDDNSGRYPFRCIVGNVECLTTEEERKKGREMFDLSWVIKPKERK